MVNILSSLGNKFDWLSGNQLDFLSPKAEFKSDIDMPFNINTDASKKSSVFAPQTTTTKSYQYAPQDARSLMVVMNSPYAQTSKKDKVSGSSLDPRINPSQSIPTDMGGTEIPFKISPNIGLGGGGSNLLFYGALGLVGYGIYKALSSKKKGGKK